ncbi:MAG: SPFH domain-containing protein [Anaerolineales bacterium]
MLYLIILLIYVGLFLYLQNYLQQHPLTVSQEYVHPEMRALWLLWHLGGPLLLPLMGILWGGILRPDVLGWMGVIVVSIFLPLTVFLIFAWWTEVISAGIALTGVGFCVLTSLLFAPLLLLSEASLLLILLFMVGLLIPPIVVILLIFLVAPDLFPFPPDMAGYRKNALAYFTGFFTTYPKPSIVVIKGEPKTRIAGNPFHGSGPGLVITEPHNAAAIKDSAKFRGVFGPGTIVTDTNEQVHSIVDLREQLRAERVEAMTRDGIKVNLPIASIFRINPGERVPELGGKWPYRSSEAYKAVFAAEVNPEGKTPLDAHESLPWEDLPLTVAKHYVKQEVARYSLDDLYAMEGQLPRGAIGGEVKERVKAEIEPKGVRVDGGGVGNKIIPVDEAVVKQRIESWKARWMRDMMKKSGQALAQRQKQLGRVRGQVLVELTRGLFKESDKFNSLSQAEARTLMTVRLLETLDHIARTPEVKVLLPESATLIVEQAHKQITGEVGDGEKEASA